MQVYAYKLDMSNVGYNHVQLLGTGMRADFLLPLVLKISIFYEKNSQLIPLYINLFIILVMSVF